MTIPLTNQIEAAERDLGAKRSTDPAAEVSGGHAKEAIARAIRSSANLGLRVADSLDHAHSASGVVPDLDS
jgi:hypothetical protein